MIPSYGVMIIPKGFKIYHASISHLCMLPNKFIICASLHPSEQYFEDAYISVIELKRDIKLIFMIHTIRHMRLFSPNYDITSCIPYLRQESIDGVIKSVNNKASIEFVLLNDASVLNFISCKPIQYNWAYSKYKDGCIVPKKWGTLYPLSSQSMPVKLLLNTRFKSQIDEYMEQMNDEDPDGTAFVVLLKNAYISYIDI